MRKRQRRFSIEVPANEPLPAATGPSGLAGCSNERFLDPATGLPLVAQYYPHRNGVWDPADSLQVGPGGTLDIRFDVVRAVATQFVKVQSDALPVLGLWFVKAFDKDDPAFVAAYGKNPNKSAYPTIWPALTGWVSFGTVPGFSWLPQGTTELRYAVLGDTMVLVYESLWQPTGDVKGESVQSSRFRDTNHDGVLEGPTLTFRVTPAATG